VDEDKLLEETLTCRYIATVHTHTQILHCDELCKLCVHCIW